jgi:protein-tyrosine kinase
MRLRSSVGLAEHDQPGSTISIDRASGRPRIGELLVESGVLREADVATALGAQEQTSRLFGETCVDLGLCAYDEVQEALRRQFDCHLLALGDDSVSEDVATAFGTDPEMTEDMRSLHAALFGRNAARGDLLALLVVAGADVETPTSLVAANFAVVVAQLGYNVLLVDANLAEPIQHRLFRLPNRLGVTTFLTDDEARESAISETAIPNLSVLPAGPAVPSAAELFERLPACPRLRNVAHHYDVILIDAGTHSPDIVASIAGGSDGAVLVVKRHRTAISQVRRLIASFADRGVQTLGAVIA